LTTLDEILDSGIEFGYEEFEKIISSLSSDLRHKEVVERGEVCWPLVVCIDRMRERGNFAIFALMWRVQHYLNSINDHSTVCLLNDDDYEFIFVTTYVQKGSFFLALLNKYITLSIESGMIAKTARDSVYVPKHTLSTINESDGYFVFSFSHLLIAFYILFFGHGVSFLVFLCEVFYHFSLRYV
jgi:hypothetical protein